MIGCTRLHGRPDASAAQKYLVRTYLDQGPTEIDVQTIPYVADESGISLLFSIHLAANNTNYIIF